MIVGHFAKHKERIEKIKERKESRYIYQNELGKACFQHGMAYRVFKELPRRTAFDNVLRDTAFNVSKIPKYDFNGLQTF